MDAGRWEASMDVAIEDREERVRLLLPPTADRATVHVCGDVRRFGRVVHLLVIWSGHMDWSRFVAFFTHSSILHARPS